MKIAVCPDSFKGTLTATEAAGAIARGVISVLPGAEIIQLPLGDGGEGTVDALATALSGVERIECDTVDALGRPIRASYAIAGGSTALIESAAASGLTLIDSSDRDILTSDTRGTGILIADAWRRGIRRFVVCMGGTATCDAGFGAFRAMQDLMPDAAPSDADFTLLCDVDNPLCGARGAAAVFAPQKGATPEMIPRLDSLLLRRALGYKASGGKDVADMPYAGAAGGLAGMLMACYGARPVAGISKVMEMLGFESRIDGADLVITGEGKSDVTTLSGKAPMGVLRAAAAKNIPVALVCGRTDDRELLLSAGFARVVQATPENPDPSVGYGEYLARAVRGLMTQWRK